MSQHFDKFDLWGIGVLSLVVVMAVLHEVSKAVINFHWKRMHRWPREGHGRTYFSDCRRVPEDEAL